QGSESCAVVGEELPLQEEELVVEEKDEEQENPVAPHVADVRDGSAESGKPSWAEELLSQHFPTESADSEEDLHSEVEIEESVEEASEESASEESASEASEALAFEEPVKASPAESSGLMERLRAMTQWEEEAGEACEE